MGGIPWTSRGCNTCRKRKVRCDLQQPQCARCIKRGVVCGGYERTRKFIHQSANTPGLANDQKAIQWAKTHTILPTVNINSQIRSQLFSLFIDAYVPSSPNPTGQVVYRYRQTPYLVEELPQFMDGKNSALLDKAISALASVFVGKTHRDDRLVHHGIRLYNQAIQILSLMIQRSRVPAEELLYATVVFQLYEIINCPSGFLGWMVHMHGANAILSRHGGSLKESRQSTELYRHLKLSNIYNAVGKATCAMRFCPMWHSLTPAKPEPVDEILDILMECTGIMERLGALQTVHNPGQAGNRILKSLLKLKQRTFLWYDRLQSAHKVLYTEAATNNQIPYTGRRNPFPEAIHFASLEIGEVHMYYWVALVLLHSLLSGLYMIIGQPVQQVSDENSPHGKPAKLESEQVEDPMLKAGYYAGQICRGVGYFLRPEMNVLGGNHLLFPVAMAAQFFHGHGYSEQYQWCQEVFLNLNSLGLGLATVLTCTPWSEYQSIEDQKLTTVMSEMEEVKLEE